MTYIQWGFNSSPRVPKDGRWFITYAASMVATGLVGIVAWKNMNPLFHSAIADARFMNNPRSCDSGSSGRRLLEYDDDDYDLLEAYWRVAARAIIGSLVPALAAGFALIQLIRQHPQTMVVVGLAMPTVFILALSAVIVTSGIPEIAIIYLPLAFVFAILAARHRSQVKLAARVLKLAADSVTGNPALVPFAFGANCTAFLSFFALGAVIYCLQGHGTVVPNPSVTSSSPGGECIGWLELPVACCAWRASPWVRPAQIAVVALILWTDGVVSQLRTYVMGGVITRWYFYEQTQGTIWQSLTHALGPARGTLCFSAAVCPICDCARGIAASIRNWRCDPVRRISDCLPPWLLDLLRFASARATVQAAATGEGFLDAARSVGETKRRHTKAANEWRVPRVVLAFTLVGVSGMVGTAAYLIAASMWAGSHRHNATIDAIALAILVGDTFVLVTGLLLGSMRSTLDVLDVCYARDLDSRAVTRPEVHKLLQDVNAAMGPDTVQPANEMTHCATEAGDSADPDSTAALLTGSAEARQRDQSMTAATEPQSPRGKV